MINAQELLNNPNNVKIMAVNSNIFSKEERFLIRSNTPCSYCGGNEREQDNKSCYSCGSVDFKDTTINISRDLNSAWSYQSMKQRTLSDDVNDLNRALFEFDPLGFLINTVNLYVNTWTRLIIWILKGTKIYV